MVSDIITNVFLNKIFIIVIDVIALFLAFVVFHDNPKGKLNKIYLGMTITMMGWVNFAYIPRIIDQKYYDLGLLSLKVAWFVTPLFFMFLYLLSVTLAEKEKRYAILTRWIVFLGIVLSVVTGFTDLVISGFQVLGGTTTIIYGEYKIPFLIGISFIIIAILSPLFDRKSILYDRKMQYFSLGLFVFLLLNAVFNITLPMFLGISQLYFLGDYSTLILLSFIAYAITSHQLFNTKVLVAEMISFFIWTAISVQFLLAGTLHERILSGSLLFFVVLFGIFLIRSVAKEVKQREKIQELNKELEKAYVIEKRAKEDTARALLAEQKANDELEKLDKIKDQFLLTAQHDLRRPLTSIKWFLGMILTGVLGKQNKKTIEGAQRIQESVETSIEEVNNFLDIAQFQSGKSAVALKPGVDVVAILEMISKKLQSQADEHGISLNFEKKSEGPILIAGDAVKLKAAITNIVDNAIKYTPKGGVTINVEKKHQETVNVGEAAFRNHEKPTVLISVKDTGIGIPKEKVGTIFESLFERTDSAKRATSMGKGIGLHLSGEIIKAHNGKVWAESQGEGKGSTFFMEIPLQG